MTKIDKKRTNDSYLNIVMNKSLPYYVTESVETEHGTINTQVPFHLSKIAKRLESTPFGLTSSRIIKSGLAQDRITLRTHSAELREFAVNNALYDLSMRDESFEELTPKPINNETSTISPSPSPSE